MLQIPWLHVKYSFDVVQNILVYIKCIGTPREVTNLQLNLQLNEHKGLFLDEKPKKLVNMDRCEI
jgi:hypothetical protein